MGVSANSQVPPKSAPKYSRSKSLEWWKILSSRRALLLEDAHGLGQDMDANELLDLGSWEVGSHGEMSECESKMVLISFHT